MVQQGGQDDVRLNIIIETFLRNIQGIAVARTELESLSQRLVKTRTAAGTFTGTMTKEFDPSMQKAGQSLSKLLEGFSPRFIGSIQGVNQAFVTTGKTLKEFTTIGLQTQAVSPQVANGLNAVSQTMTAVGVTGRVSTQVIQQLREQLAALKPVTDADTAVLTALNQQLDILGTQTMVAAEQAAARTTRQLTTTQKAGQGMLLSFALTQAAAGKLSQAMFGLGFAVIFTGTQFLNLTTILTATSLALASIALDKFQNRLSTTEKITAKVTETTNRFKDALIEIKGEARLTAEALAELSAEEARSAEAWERLFEEAAKAPGVLDIITTSLTGTAKGFVSLISPTGGLSDAFQKFREEIETIDPEIKTEKLRESMRELGNIAMEGAKRVSEEFKLEEAREIRLEARLDVIVEGKETLSKIYDGLREEATKYYDEQKEIAAGASEARVDAIRDGLQEETKAIRRAGREQTQAIQDALQDQITARRKALNEELDIIRDSAEEKIDVIRDGLERERDAIRDQAEGRVDAVRDALEDEIDAIRDRLDDRIDAIKDSAKDEIEAEKDKIDALEDQERELSKILSDLQSEREQIRGAIIGSEAELAALEREAALTGVGATEEQAIVKARIEGLRAQDAAIAQTIKEKEKERAEIEQQIESIEELIEAIEDARDDAIEAAKDEADARVEAAEDAADEIIDAINETRDKAIDAAEERADNEIKNINKIKDNAITAAREQASDEITEAQRSTRERIQAVNDYTTEAIEDAQDRSEEDVKAEQARAEAADIAYDDQEEAATDYFDLIEERRETVLEQEEEEIRKAERLANALWDEVLPAYQEILGTVGEMTGANLLGQTGFAADVIADIIKGMNLPYELEKLILSQLFGIENYQLGTRAVPGAIGQPQLAMVHGGEKITPHEDIQPRIMPILPALPPPQEKLLVRDVYLTVNVKSEADLKKVTRIVGGEIGKDLNASFRRGSQTSFRNRKRKF